MSDKIAYFSMEIGINHRIKTYSGGLGVLAGDTLKSAADLGENFVAVTLLYRDGYFKQVFEDDWQREEKQFWDYESLLEDTGKEISLEVFEETIKVRIWKYTIEGEESSIDVIFLDTNIGKNSAEVRELTSRLYAGGDKTRLGQEVLLGIGGVKALEELGIEPDFYHMNEGHSALLTLEADADKVFTTHTPVEAGHDKFDRETVKTVLGDRSKELNLDNGLNMTEQALSNSKYCNAVSDKHEEVSQEMFPDADFDSITNGVHSSTWTSKHFESLFDEYIGGWKKDPQRLSRALKVSDKDIWSAKKSSKVELVDLVEQKCGEKFDVENLTVGFARRSTSYKRPCLIFKDMDELERIGKKYNGFNLIFGGKAHPNDDRGKEIISKIQSYSEMLENVEVYYLPDYGMHDALKMVSGCDLWLNNPRRGQEASGTSGMKAAHNGTPQLSTLDGWWIEGHIEDVTGWSIGEDYVEGEQEDLVDSRSIYSKLDHILSLYHNDRKQWIEIMKNCIAINASYFNTHRMVKEYVSKAYK